MALLRTAGLCRLALRTQWACARLCSSVTAAGEAPRDGAKPGRLFDLEALRRERRPLAEPAPPRRVLSGVKPSYEQVQLNKAITRCTSVDQVLDLAAAQPALLNGVIVSTALSVTARLMANREPARGLKADARFKQLLRAALALMESGQMDAQGFSNMLYALGQLGIAPPPSWLRAYFNCSAMVLGEFVPQALSNTMYSCGLLGIKPPDEWLRYFWHIDASKMAMSVPQDFSNTMYACGQLGVMPAPDWLQRFWHASALKISAWKPQDFSNVMYGCAQLGIVAPVEWLQRFWVHMATKLGEFNQQNYSNLLYSCGQLGITPPADWLQRFWHVSGPRLHDFLPQGLSNLLLGCAQLNAMPPDYWLQSYSDSFERLLPTMNRQDLSNTAVSLAMLGLWELRVWPGLWEHFCRSWPRDTASWDAEARLHARQLYQVFQTAAVERPGLLRALEPELYDVSRQSWIEGMDDWSSKLHADVSTFLTSMGVEHTNERWCDRAERSIDIAIEGEGAPIALEVDGPTHFLQDGRPNGRTGLRNRMLAAHGWRVVVLNHRDWESLDADSQRKEYLRRLLS